MDRRKRLTPFAGNLFPVPHLHNPKLREGYHFTEDALHQMTPHKKARAISELCDTLMRDAGHAAYDIIDTCAGIGGNTMAFALHPSVRAVYACECDANTFAMLQHNLRNLRHTSLVQARHAHFSLELLRELAAPAAEAGIDLQDQQPAPLDGTKPVGLFIDPPWGLQRPYLDLFHRPLMPCVGAGSSPGGAPTTVCEWLKLAMSLASVVFVAIKVPKGYPWNDADTPEHVCMRRVTSVAKMDILCFSRTHHDADTNKCLP